MPALLSKIRQTFIITYIRDVILLRHLDDATVRLLSFSPFLSTVTIADAFSTGWHSQLDVLLQHRQCDNAPRERRGVY